MSKRRHILIIEDEPDLIRGLRDALEFEGFQVSAASSGREGLDIWRTSHPDLVLLDLMLPDFNGYAVCEQIRSSDALVPILMLTARSQEADKIRGLDAGADDYVTKPFSVGELLARIKALFRRVDRPHPPEECLEIGLAQINLAAHSLTRGRHSHQLSFYEVELLRLLYERVNQPVSRNEILERIWGLEAIPTNRTVDNFIVKLRRKIEVDSKNPKHILTVYGYGYKLVV